MIVVLFVLFRGSVNADVTVFHTDIATSVKLTESLWRCITVAAFLLSVTSIKAVILITNAAAKKNSNNAASSTPAIVPSSSV